jgi:hypothetical protein
LKVPTKVPTKVPNMPPTSARLFKSTLKSVPLSQFCFGDV